MIRMDSLYDLLVFILFYLNHQLSRTVKTVPQKKSAVQACNNKRVNKWWHFGFLEDARTHTYAHTLLIHLNCYPPISMLLILSFSLLYIYLAFIVLFYLFPNRWAECIKQKKAGISPEKKSRTIPVAVKAPHGALDAVSNKTLKTT